VLTRETIKKFVEVGLNDKKPLCNMNVEGADDWNVGRQVVISLTKDNLFIASRC
jgi:hypothetical protein